MYCSGTSSRKLSLLKGQPCQPKHWGTAPPLSCCEGTQPVHTQSQAFMCIPSHSHPLELVWQPVVTSCVSTVTNCNSGPCFINRGLLLCVHLSWHTCKGKLCRFLEVSHSNTRIFTSHWTLLLSASVLSAQPGLEGISLQDANIGQDSSDPGDILAYYVGKNGFSFSGERRKMPQPPISFLSNSAY